MAHTSELAALARTYGVSTARLHSARRYLYGGLAWGTLSQLWLLGVLAHLCFRGQAGRAASWLRARIGRAWKVYLLYSLGLLAALDIALLPWALWMDYFRESLYGFERQSLAAWLADWSKQALVGLAAGGLLALLFYWLARRFPRRWWLAAWALVTIFMALTMAVEPIWIEPLFNHFTPIQDQRLKSEILAEARRAGVPHASIYQVNRGRQSAHTNAYVVGLLGSERVVVYNTLLHDDTPAEVRFVVAHELGHYVLHHLWIGLAFGAALLLPLFWLGALMFEAWARRLPERLGCRQPSDPAALPLLLLILALLLFIATPAINGFSRWEEHQADAYALKLDPDPAAGIAAFKQFVHTDLSYPAPPEWVVWWFYNHPSLEQRIRFLERKQPISKRESQTGWTRTPARAGPEGGVGQPRYCSSPTCSSHSTVLPASRS